MEVLPLLLACSLLFTIATPIRDIADACTSQINGFAHLNSSGVHLTLHHPQSPCSPAPLPFNLPFSAVVTHDEARVAHLASRLASNDDASSRRPTSSLPLLHGGHRKNKASVAASLASSVPLTPGASVGVGNYVTRLGLGTPATSYVMVVDTGSSLTWLQCSPCSVSCHRQAGPVFDPRASGTYAAVQCGSSECGELQTATLNPSACSRSNVCIYQASYGDSSYSVGYLSKDTVSFGSGYFPDFYYGCGQDNEGLFGRSAGLIGLAKNKLSLFYQLAPSLGYAFSYCLPTSSAAAGYLSIGSYNPGQYSYTPMASSDLDASLYFISLSGMSVAGSPLAVSPSEYGSLPTIIDSGTVITRLPANVYTALSRAVAAAMAGAPRAPTYSILDTCFQGTAAGLRVPAVDMTFAGGATLRLAPRNVLVDVDDSTTCLAFAPTGGTAIIGNTQQQTFSVVYDVAQSRIGFAAGGCS
ncbi:aspartyl protease family protein At5g10770-like [Oryza brachyantha]|uniref:aspartyl protease family protein At5g10770-like n=1 Tax=Oryza brachyantha TaxID=4533 RepID=UPI001ADB8ED9|nr:aspartyl protease family protein At5g10770-like [Oryza brachyantha]XP_040381004.1 aspartyl protease family protein At5g10770-like [Oryza brachyantha]